MAATRKVSSQSRLLIYKDESRTEVKVGLEGYVFQDRDESWIAFCPDLDLSTCGTTEDAAYEAMRQSIDLFIRSCIERGTLEQALRELGWHFVSPQGHIEELGDRGLVKIHAPPAFMIDAFRRSREGKWASAIRFQQ